MPSSRSPLAGFLISSPAAFAVWIVCLHTWTHLTRGPVDAAGITLYALIGGVLFGLPILAATILFVALPFSWLLERAIGITPRTAVVAGALCGVIVRLVVEQMWGQPEIRFVPWPVVLLTGAVTGWIWWRVR